MIRLVLAVLLTAALLGASLPAVEEGRGSRTDTLVGAELTRFERVATALRQSNDPVSLGDGGARRLVTLRVPGASWTSARATVALGGAAGQTDRLGWSRGGTTRSRRLPVDLRVVADGSLRPDGTPLELGPGRHRLALGLVRVDGRAVVTVRRFKRWNGMTPTHVHRPRLHVRAPVRG
ncbi:DUF7311 family protein [Natronomonas sp. EA1]|uniref:DUF7311 family protein n=1 Tax=Natronomonas sp. EA1 TaxID=3421655 RepID=UPI003EC0E628